jgi:hypothetical protein
MATVPRQTPVQSGTLVYRRMMFSAIAHGTFVAAPMISLAAEGASVQTFALPVLAGGLALLVVWSVVWIRRGRRMTATADGQIPYWPAGAPPALAAQLGVGTHARGADRPVPGRVTFGGGTLAWHPTTRRVPTGYPSELGWDSSWQRTMDRPWYLWIYGGGRLTLSRAGDEDVMLWVFDAPNFRRVTQTPGA